MGDHTEIAWTSATMNFWLGCTEVSPGCEKCYARELAKRYGWVQWGQGQARRRTAPANWRKPYTWDRQAAAAGERRRVFTCSLADFFDAEVPPVWRADAWQVIRDCGHLDWQILTKRPNLIRRYLPDDWGEGWPHVWLGTTVESSAYLWRAWHLARVPAVIRFLSCEPLIGPVNLHEAPWVDWVIVGGESGPGYRPMDWGWVRAIKAHCQRQGIAFFLKQDSGPRPGQNAVLDGQQWQAFPTWRALEPAMP